MAPAPMVQLPADRKRTVIIYSLLPGGESPGAHQWSELESRAVGLLRHGVKKRTYYGNGLG